ncbi:heavy-metal-associated domain-containing protein [Arthrobacter mobilis]|uniref:Heavy-metal-associated domain-containing protein n=1 Tax=Arthrobacter mobilis TaxID=2724944 RepID=A0A7X6K3Y0_9MICC|nr:heavy-metal-associated domain-containing protein [Arthrobacter mobilis]NKX54787.1 heavy-metal-associated domain-containing protein [Arthrobacter mobilis]
MRVPTKLGLYGAGLAALFAGSLAVAQAVMPAEVAPGWAAAAAQEGGTMEEHAPSGTTGPAAAGTGTDARGLSLEQDGYVLGPVEAPHETGQRGRLSFTVTGPDGDPLTGYTRSHEKELHLIIVRSDGAGFRHVHPVRDQDGVWSVPWQWDAPGSYRIFADFVPAALGSNVTLSRTIDVLGDVAGETSPASRSMSTTAETGGFTVALDGSLQAGGESTLRFTVTRGGKPVTSLQPYLGAYGHLVALREGDLAYLHVHPEGEPGDGRTEPGPAIEFMTQAPTAGTYLLYLDFQVDGVVHTAGFTLTAGTAASSPGQGGTHGHSSH